MNGPPYREFMLWGICMIVPSRGFRSSMRNPRKNTLSCRTIMKLLSSTPLSKRFFLPHGRQNEIVIPSVCEESPRLFYRLRFFTSHCSVQNDIVPQGCNIYGRFFLPYSRQNGSFFIANETEKLVGNFCLFVEFFWRFIGRR